MTVDLSIFTFLIVAGLSAFIWKYRRAKVAVLLDMARAELKKIKRIQESADAIDAETKKNWIKWLTVLCSATLLPTYRLPRRGVATLLLACTISGCGTIEHRYPLHEAPTRPSVHFQDTGRHCLSDAGLRQLTGYVIRLEGALQKYRKEIEIINEN